MAVHLYMGKKPKHIFEKGDVVVEFSVPSILVDYRRIGKSQAQVAATEMCSIGT